MATEGQKSLGKTRQSYETQHEEALQQLRRAWDTVGDVREGFLTDSYAGPRGKVTLQLCGSAEKVLRQIKIMAG